MIIPVSQCSMDMLFIKYMKMASSVSEKLKHSVEQISKNFALNVYSFFRAVSINRLVIEITKYLVNILTNLLSENII